MFSRQLRVFALLAVVVALAQANWFDDHIFHRRAAFVERAGLLSDIGATGTGVLNGLLGTGTTSSGSSTSSSVKTTSVSTTTSSTPSSTRPSSSSSTPSSTSSSTKDSSTTTPSSSNTPTPTKTPAPTDSSVSASVGVVTHVTTISGNPVTSESSYTTSATQSTTSPGLSQNQSSSTTMSAKTKNTVIGVVGGVGGAVVIAGLFVVAWRIWGRRKNDDDSDGLMGFRSGSAGRGHEKSSSVSGAGPANPFQSTLENYHDPARNVNASSNF